MFGTKKTKGTRLERIQALLDAGERSIEQLARETGVDRATIERDIRTLEDTGILLYEGRKGRIGIARWHRKK